MLNMSLLSTGAGTDITSNGLKVLTFKKDAKHYVRLAHLFCILFK